ncbi:MAG: hypothetical protein EOO23_01935 [Comamonadaceae bacterium]|nr:MAG: hypothetical protein EOO23_01935 [Comamonadaceae bacterium]
MKPTVDVYAAALPWYGRDDFQRLWELAHDRDEMPGDYEAWHAAALNVMNAWLARGRALQIVSIRPDEFLAWLDAEKLPNTAATRLKYVEQKAAGATSETVAADSDTRRMSALSYKLEP